MVLLGTMKQAHAMCILHPLIRAMRTGSTVNAAAVENTVPPNNRVGAPDLAPINAVGRTITNAYGPTRKTSRNLAGPLESMRFERCRATCELRRSRRYSCTPARLPTQKQSRKLLPHPLSEHVKRCSATRLPLRRSDHSIAPWFRVQDVYVTAYASNQQRRKQPFQSNSLVLPSHKLPLEN
jgi:hypothetical protein